MTGDPIAYAERTLDVHGVWKETEERLALHRSLTEERADLLRHLRSVRAAMADREAEIVQDVTGRYPELSDTARNRIVKTEVHADREHSGHRERERDLQSSLDLVDGNLDHHEKGVKALSARMVELGGLLNFYAAAKTAAHLSVSSK